MNLVVSMRTPLERRYGAEGYGAIRQALADYAVSTPDGSAVVVLDDTAEMLPFGLAIASTTPPAIVGAVRQLRGLLPVSSLLLIGSDALVPAWTLDNPVVDRRADPDPVVVTDNPYGTLADTLEEYLTPALAVGRLVEPPGRTAAEFVAAIQFTAEHHRRRTRRAGSAAVFNREWERPVRAVIDVLLPVVDEHHAPGYQIHSGNTQDLDRGFLYFNLHGFPDDPAWKAFDPVRGTFATVVTPSALTDVDMSGTIVFAENCYGALLPAGRGTCATEMVRRGAAAFVGATGLAFGSHIRPDLLLDNADFLARSFLARAVAGTRAGDALVGARQDYAADPSVSALNPFKQKTLLQFRLLGDPSLN